MSIQHNQKLQDLRRESGPRVRLRRGAQCIGLLVLLSFTVQGMASVGSAAGSAEIAPSDQFTTAMVSGFDSAPSAASSSWTGGAVTAVAIDGGIAWTIIGTRLVAWDLAATPPARLGRSEPMSEVAEDVAVKNGVAIVATRAANGSSATAHVFDISDPAVPELLSETELSLSLAREIGGVDASPDGRLALLVTEKGLSIVDISSPEIPREIAWIGTGDRVSGGAFDAYDWQGDVVAAQDGEHVLVARPWGLYVVHVGDGSNPYLVLDPAQAEGERGRWRSQGITIDGETAWLVDAEAEELVALDISDATWPREIGRTQVGPDARAVSAVDGRIAVLDSGGTRLMRFDGSDSANVRPQGNAILAAAPDVHAKIALADRHGPALVAIGSSGMHVVSEAYGPGTEMVSHRIEEIIPPLVQLEIKGVRAYAAAGPSGIVALDLSDPSMPVIESRIDVLSSAGAPAGVYALRRVDDTLYALTDVDGLAAFDLSTTGEMTRRKGEAYDTLAAIPGRRRATTITALGREIAFADGAGAVRIVDVRFLEEPRMITTVPGDFKDVVFAGRFLYALDVSMGFGRLSVIARSLMMPGGAPFISAEISMPRPFHRLLDDQDRLLLSGEPSTAALGVVSLDDPLSPKSLGYLDGLAAGRPLLDGAYGLTADRGQLHTIDLDGPDGPALVDAGPPLAWGRALDDDGPSDVHRVGDHLVLLRGRAGLFSAEWPRERSVGYAASAGSLSTCTPPAHLALIFDQATPTELRKAMFDAAWAERSTISRDGGAGSDGGIGLGVASFGSQAERHLDVRRALSAIAGLGGLGSGKLTDDAKTPGSRLDLALAAAEHELKAMLGAPGPDGAILVVAASHVVPEAQEAAQRRARTLRNAGTALHLMAAGPDVDRSLLIELTGDPARTRGGVDMEIAAGIARAVASGGCSDG